MSDVLQRTVYWYRVKKTMWDATDSINVTREYIEFMPFCKVEIAGQTYIEPWNGVVSANWKSPSVNMANFDFTDPASRITALEEVNPDTFSIQISGDVNNARLHGGEPNTRVGR
jgi:hypothetical protein